MTREVARMLDADGRSPLVPELAAAHHDVPPASRLDLSSHSIQSARQQALPIVENPEDVAGGEASAGVERAHAIPARIGDELDPRMTREGRGHVATPVACHHDVLEARVALPHHALDGLGEMFGGTHARRHDGDVRPPIQRRTYSLRSRRAR